MAPSDTSNHPGVLPICLGMPIMIKKNKATECSVTNEAEGIVVGWKSKPLNKDHNMLQVLFVKLTSNPVPIQLAGLPENVVPVVAESMNIRCKIHNGQNVDVSRTQVPVVLNFAMTDFASQGRTRKFNVIDITHSRNHQSIYTCLSRSSSYSGTLIIQDFTDKHMTGGLSGYLRQEFRELELLDEVTKLRFNNELPSGVGGLTRTHLIHSYRLKRGEKYMPKNMPDALRWSDRSPFTIADPFDEAQWEIVDNKQVSKEKNSGPTSNTASGTLKSGMQSFVVASGTKKLPKTGTEISGKKRKRNDNDKSLEISQKRRRKSSDINLNNQQRLFKGLVWNFETYSCAYDSLFTILYNFMQTNPTQWNKLVHIGSDYLKLFSITFQNINFNLHTLEDKRESVRLQLSNDFPSMFPMTRDGADARELCDVMLSSGQVLMHKVHYCSTCQVSTGETEADSDKRFQCSKLTWQNKSSRLGSINGRTISVWLQAMLQTKSSMKCSTCDSRIVRRYFLTHPMPFIHVIIDDDLIVNMEHSMTICESTYTLIGMIQFGNFHFTSRIVDRNGGVWFHDGISTGHDLDYEGSLQNIDMNMLQKSKDGRKCSVVIYALTT
jgi:hypothetical protein